LAVGGDPKTFKELALLDSNNLEDKKKGMPRIAT